MLLTRSFVEDTEVLMHNVSSAVVSREDTVCLVVVSLLAGGHLLLRDLPGVGKTLLARSLASSIDGTFKRVQFTPDLLPTDITGSSIFDQGGGRFEFVPGPVFCNILLADEINRTSPRTQSALLEAMAERQVTVDGASHSLPDPFWVVATQNEVDGYGTFPLPQAQLDRFMIALSIGYPSVQEQVTILERNEHGDPALGPVLTTDRIREMQAAVRLTDVAVPVREYIARILLATREHPKLALGASPRAGVQLQRGAQALATLQGATFVAPEHVKALAVPVLTHRILPSPAADLGPEEIVQEVLENVPVPV